MIDKKEFRKLLISLLDDEDGVNQEAYQQLLEQAPDYGAMDIISQVHSQDSRFFLYENHGIES